MVGRQTPILAVFVPLLLVYVVDGKRGLRQTWLPAIVSGIAFAIAQFVAANYISVPLTDIIAALVSAAAVVALLRVWSPVESPDLARHDRAHVGGGAGAGSAGVTAGEELGGRPGDQDARDDHAPGTGRRAGAGPGGPVQDS